MNKTAWVISLYSANSNALQGARPLFLRLFVPVKQMITQESVDTAIKNGIHIASFTAGAMVLHQTVGLERVGTDLATEGDGVLTGIVGLTGGIALALLISIEAGLEHAHGAVSVALLRTLVLALGHDAVFVHAGGSPEFYEKTGDWKLTTVDGVNGYYAYASTGLFWRDKNRVAGKNFGYEHSLITSGEKLNAILTKRDLLTDHADGYTYEMSFTADGTPADGKAALSIDVPFTAGGKTTSFHYDDATGVYKVEQYGGAYIDGNDGTQVSATNVLVLTTECTVVDSEGRLTVDLSSGDGWYAYGGKYIPITWEKGQRNQQMRYFTADGQPLTLGQGKSYVCIVPEGREIIVK